MFAVFRVSLLYYSVFSFDRTLKSQDVCEEQISYNPLSSSDGDDSASLTQLTCSDVHSGSTR